jgi:hypothetical protein
MFMLSLPDIPLAFDDALKCGWLFKSGASGKFTILGQQGPCEACIYDQVSSMQEHDNQHILNMSARAEFLSYIELPLLQNSTPYPPWGLVLRSHGYTTIDSFVFTHLLRPSFPSFLNSLVATEVKRCVTPPLFWGGDPSYSPGKYEELFKAAMYIGRAYALLSAPLEYSKLDLQDEKAFPFRKLPVELRLQIYEHFEVRHNARETIWSQVINPVFTKAFLSGRDPEPAARYIAGLIVLSCGYSLSQTPNLTGKGVKWSWMDDTMDEDATWDWSDLYAAVMKTENLSRDCTVWEECQRRIEGSQPEGRATDHEYVPAEVLDVLDAARYTLKADMRDLRVEDILELLLVSPRAAEVLPS